MGRKRNWKTNRWVYSQNEYFYRTVELRKGKVKSLNFRTWHVKPFQFLPVKNGWKTRTYERLDLFLTGKDEQGHSNG